MSSPSGELKSLVPFGHTPATGVMQSTSLSTGADAVICRVQVKQVLWACLFTSRSVDVLMAPGKTMYVHMYIYQELLEVEVEYR
eukprot:1193217-Prorocentrum_minimum.AAC.2